MKVAFLGRGKLGINVLRGLLDINHIEVPIVITCGATPEVEYSEDAFKKVADQNNITFIKTNHINQQKYVDLLNDLDIDLVVALLWLYKIESDVINASKHGIINCHSGLLPKYRGNACGNWSIINGESNFGITTHFMKAGELDNGDIINQIEVPICDETNIRDLVSAFQEKGAELVLDAVESIHHGNFNTKPQIHENASYCYPRIESDGEINWSQSALQIWRLVRAAGKPYPGAYSWFKDVRDGLKTKKMIIHEVEIVEHELNEYHAVPGHLIKHQNGDFSVVCGDKKLILLSSVEISGVTGRGSSFFKTVRQRLGLDTGSILFNLETRLENLEQELTCSSDFSSQFLKTGYEHLENYELNVNYVVDEVAKKLENKFTLEKNPLRNYSFQKRFYYWEGRERWAGIQIYRSFKLEHLQDWPLSFGAWYFTDEQTQLRVYAYVKSEFKSQYGNAISSVFEKFEQSGEVTAFFPGKGDNCEAAFVVVPNIESAMNTLKRVVINTVGVISD